MTRNDHRIAACTLQIPITDSDVPVATHTLPHQMKKLGQFADDVLISINRPVPPTDPRPLDELLDGIVAEFSNVRVVEVEYDQNSVDWVSETFFGGRDYPLSDFKGIPIHAFLEQYRQSRHPHFFQLAADMMLGGVGDQWLNEAIEHLDRDPLTLTVSPLGGPAPRGGYHSGGSPTEVGVGLAFRVPSFSSRDYLVKLDEFLPAMADLDRLPPPRWVDSMQARLVGTAGIDHFEKLFEHRMVSTGKHRLDFEGSGGFWTLHPLYKTPEFVAGLPGLLEAIDAGQIPEGQRGRYDLHHSFLPQSDIPGRRQIASNTFGKFKHRVASNVRRRVGATQGADV